MSVKLKGKNGFWRIESYWLLDIDRASSLSQLEDGRNSRGKASMKAWNGSDSFSFHGKVALKVIVP